MSDKNIKKKGLFDKESEVVLIDEKIDEKKKYEKIKKKDDEKVYHKNQKVFYSYKENGVFYVKEEDIKNFKSLKKKYVIDYFNKKEK